MDWQATNLLTQSEGDDSVGIVGPAQLEHVRGRGARERLELLRRTERSQATQLVRTCRGAAQGKAGGSERHPQRCPHRTTQAINPAQQEARQKTRKQGLALSIWWRWPFSCTLTVLRATKERSCRYTALCTGPFCPRPSSPGNRTPDTRISRTHHQSHRRRSQLAFT